jgi:hypothetical protein
MNKMKKILLTMVALMAMTCAMAQNNESKKAPKQMTAAEMTTQMTSKLGLSDEQAAKVKLLNEEYADVLKGPGMGGHRPQMKSENGSSDSNSRPQMTDEQIAQMKQQMEKRQEYNTKLKAILSESQYKTYQQMQPQRGGKGGKGPKPTEE